MNYTTPDLKQKDSDKTEIPYFSPLLMITLSFFISLSMLWPNSITQFNKLITQSSYLYNLIGCSCFVYLLLISTEIVTLTLDKDYKWDDDFFKRLYLQLLFGGLAAVVLLFTIYYIYLFIIEVDLANYLHLGHIPFVVIMLNMMYGFYYYVALVHEFTNKTNEGKPNNHYRNYFTVPVGLSNIEFNLIEIAYLYRENRDIFLKTFEGKRYPLWQSLDEIEKELDPKHFFRVNRTYIVNRNAVVNATKNTRRGLDIYITQASSNDNSADRELLTLELSREKVKAFKCWLNEDDFTLKNISNTIACLFY